MTIKYIGAHISKEGGDLIKTIDVIINSGGNALQLFASNPRSVTPPNIEKYTEVSSHIVNYCKKNDFKLVIHSSYTINLAKEAKNNKRVIDLSECYWTKLIINELIVADLINSIGTVVHVGKYTTLSQEEGMLNMFNAIKYIITQLKILNIKSKLIIETPAGAGTELLTDVSDFINFYNSFTDDDKKHLGICLDTAHIWSSGYDINEYYDIISKTNSKDICVIHYNNSKKNKSSMVDTHDHLLDGKIPLGDLMIFIKKLKYNPIIILEKPSPYLKNEFVWVKDNLYKD